MDFRRLVEPAGLLYGVAAQEAVKRGDALPLAGGPAAFTCVDLIEDNTRSGFMPVAAVPAGWEKELSRVASRPVSGKLPEKPLVMGILNLTPDSFSDGGTHLETSKAVEAGQAMVRAGAGVLDLGGESTRPGSLPVTPQEEWNRIGPALSALRKLAPDVVLSVDTRNGFVMEQALAVGADVINDVSALAHDPDALPLLAEHECGVVLMHMRGVPETMAQHAVYENVGYEVVRELGQRVQAAVDAGIARERLVIDPGLGFAKTTEQNREMLARLPLLANLGCRVLLGLSRKRMIGELTGVSDPARRDPATQTATLEALPLGNSILRVHEVEGMVQAVTMWRAVHAA